MNLPDANAQSDTVTARQLLDALHSEFGVGHVATEVKVREEKNDMKQTSVKHTFPKAAKEADDVILSKEKIEELLAMRNTSRSSQAALRQSSTATSRPGK